MVLMLFGEGIWAGGNGMPGVLQWKFWTEVSAPIGGSVRVHEFKRKTVYCKNART